MNLRLSTAPHIRCGDTTRSLMLNVLIALVPCAVTGIYNFGWDAVLVLFVSMVTCIAAEYLFQIIAKRPVRAGDLSALVTGMILGLNLPSDVPIWLIMIGAVIAIVLVKELFGGIGSNFMNPALTARAVLLASWPVAMTRFVTPTYWADVDAVTTATPLVTGRAQLLDLFIGRVPGSIGEVSAMMILVGFAYLLITRTISWRIPTVMVGTAFVLSWLLSGSLYEATYAVLSGGLLFGAVFMATDYTTSPMTARGQMLYAAGCGLIVVVIRRYGAYPEGVTYAILLMNIATPLIDKYVRHRVYGHGIGKEKKADA